MASQTDSSIPPLTEHAPQYYADFSSPARSNQNDELPPPPPYTAIEIPPSASNVEYMKSFTNPSAIVNEVVNERIVPTNRRPLNPEQIRRVTQYINNQEKAINDKLVVAVCISIIGIAVGATCIGLYLAYHNDLCDSYYQTTLSCSRAYVALIVGCISIILGVFRIVVYGMAKAKINRAKTKWLERVAQLQPTSLNSQ